MSVHQIPNTLSVWAIGRYLEANKLRPMLIRYPRAALDLPVMHKSALGAILHSLAGVPAVPVDYLAVGQIEVVT